MVVLPVIDRNICRPHAVKIKYWFFHDGEVFLNYLTIFICISQLVFFFDGKYALSIL